MFNAVLADIDNDGWHDLFVATYRQGNYLVMNRAGQLDTANPQPVAKPPRCGYVAGAQPRGCGP